MHGSVGARSVQSKTSTFLFTTLGKGNTMSTPAPSVTVRAKCIVAGDTTVGKSSLCQMFHSDGSHYAKNYTMTAGVEILVKPVNIPETRDTVELFLYDSAGKEIFSDHVQKFWEHPSVVMLVFDVTNETSFSSCAKWLERVRSQKPDVHIPGVLIGNKVDLEQRQLVSPKTASNFAENNGLKYFECSAKEFQNVDAPFYYLANEFYKLYQEKVEHFKTLS